MAFRNPGSLLGTWRDTVRASELCVTVTEWADRYRWLARNASASPGQWQTARTPYLRLIQDVLSVDDPTWKVIIKGPNQCGKSEAANNAVCYRIDQFPCPMLWVVPRDKDVLKYVNTRFDPMFAAMPRISGLIGKDESGAEASDNAVMKRFPGGQLMVAGSTSPAVFRSDPIEMVVLDDLDACGTNVEGDIVELATKRTNTFSQRARKVVCISTPTIEGASRIDREYKSSSQRRYHVPCPECGAFQALEWERLVYVKEAPMDARYKCAHCGAEIEEHHKVEMLRLGDWRAERPDLIRKVEGFHLNALYSPWKRWGDIVLAFLAAKLQLDTEGVHDKLQTFYNLELGETFVLPSKVKLEGVEREVYQRREPPFDARSLPTEMVTVGVDVQANRLEASVYAWGAGMESWLLEHVVVKGAVEENGVWDELATVATGHRATAVCVDARDNTQTVEDQVQRLMPALLEQRCLIWAIQGQAGKRSIWPRAVRPGETVIIGVDSAKDAIYGSLERITAPGPGYIHLPTSCNQAWFKQLFSERLSVPSDKTRARYVKVAGRRRNEALDCAVYARAGVYALCALDPGLAQRLLQLGEQRARPTTPSPPRPPQRLPTSSQPSSSWATGGSRPGRGGGFGTSWATGGRRRRR